MAGSIALRIGDRIVFSLLILLPVLVYQNKGIPTE
jgi:hypothetical protein